MAGEYVNPDPIPEHKDYQWSKHDKIKGLGRLKHDELSHVPVPGKNPRPLNLDIFGVVAIAELGPKQVEWLLSKKHSPHRKDAFHWLNSVLKFEKYIVKEINKFPEKDVGRVVKIRTLYHKKGNAKGNEVELICLNKYKNPNRLQLTVFFNDKAHKTDRKQFIKDLAFQLRLAFRS